MRPGFASSVKAALFASIMVSLWMMWAAKDSVAEAYQQTPEVQELRLSGVDLSVARTEIEESPFSVPAAPDTRRRPLPAIGLSVDDPLEDPPPVEMAGGTSRLRGTVVGPEGPVDQAVVGIERHTSHGVGLLRVTTTAEGNWSADGVPGGRYRVRAWVPGLMAMDRSEVVFVGEHEVADFGFSLWSVDPEPVMEFVHGGPIHEGLSGTVAVVVSQQSVDQDGFVVTTPVVGIPVSVAVGSDVTLTSSPTRLTDQSGSAQFVVACIPAPASTGRPSNPSADPGPTITGSTAGVANNGIGTLTARSGSLVEVFPLPGCIPAPVAEIRPPTPGPAVPGPVDPGAAEAKVVAGDSGGTAGG